MAKASALKTLGIASQAAVPENLDQVATRTAEDEEIARERVAPTSFPLFHGTRTGFTIEEVGSCSMVLSPC